MLAKYPICSSAHKYSLTLWNCHNFSLFEQIYKTINYNFFLSFSKYGCFFCIFDLFGLGWISLDSLVWSIQFTFCLLQLYAASICVFIYKTIHYNFFSFFFQNMDVFLYSWFVWFGLDFLLSVCCSCSINWCLYQGRIYLSQTSFASPVNRFGFPFFGLVWFGRLPWIATSAH